MLEPVRIADGDRDLPDADAARITEPCPRHLRIHAQHREVGSGVLPDDIGPKGTAIRQDHFDTRRAVDKRW